MNYSLGSRETLLCRVAVCGPVAIVVANLLVVWSVVSRS